MSLREVRRQAPFRACALALCATQLMLSLSGCSLPSSLEGGQAEPLSGETLYRGIYFGQGDFLSRVPELGDSQHWKASLTESQQTALNEFTDRLIAAISRTDAEFFDTFSREVQSGDHLRISRMLERSSAVSLKALESIPEVANWRTKLAENRESVQAELIRLHNAGQLSKNDLQAARAQLDLLLAAQGNGSPGVEPNKEIEPELDFAVAVAIVLAVVIVVPPILAAALAVAVVYAYAYVTSAIRSPGSLTRDMIVDAFARRLAVAPGKLDFDVRIK